jgi:hypothetical protein
LTDVSDVAASIIRALSRRKIRLNNGSRSEKVTSLAGPVGGGGGIAVRTDYMFEIKLNVTP